ncbi:MAG: hypothetical protein Ct9H300mP15_13670 [Gemmatimonadota bacterium]|nr:MAG: hypothetical protein Ct9H300mP15_13670 [Gemmatimonadota bacterium]
MRTRSGVIGLYDAAPDPEGGHAAELLMEAAVEWAVAHDLEELFAPVDVNTWFKYRAMLYPKEGVSGQIHSVGSPQLRQSISITSLITVSKYSLV